TGGTGRRRRTAATGEASELGDDGAPAGEDAVPAGDDAAPSGEDVAPSGEDVAPSGDAGTAHDDVAAGGDAGPPPPPPLTGPVHHDELRVAVESIEGAYIATTRPVVRGGGRGASSAAGATPGGGVRVVGLGGEDPERSVAEAPL